MTESTTVEVQGAQIPPFPYNPVPYNPVPSLTDRKELFAALLAVATEVEYVQKERSNELKYSYASERAFIEKLRPAMIRNGIMIIPQGYYLLKDENFTAKSGTVFNRTVVASNYKIIHAPSGQSIDIATMGEGADSGDKAANKAMTGALKYALRQTFLIETGDDPDHTSSELMEKEAVQAVVRAAEEIASKAQPLKLSSPPEKPAPAKTTGSTRDADTNYVGWVDRDGKTPRMYCDKHGRVTRAKYWPHNFERDFLAGFTCSEKDTSGAWCKGRTNEGASWSAMYNHTGRLPTWYKALSAAITVEGRDESIIGATVELFERHPQSGLPTPRGLEALWVWAETANLSFERDLEQIVAVFIIDADQANADLNADFADVLE